MYPLVHRMQQKMPIDNPDSGETELSGLTHDSYLIRPKTHKLRQVLWIALACATTYAAGFATHHSPSSLCATPQSLEHMQVELNKTRFALSQEIATRQALQQADSAATAELNKDRIDLTFATEHRDNTTASSH